MTVHRVIVTLVAPLGETVANIDVSGVLARWRAHGWTVTGPHDIPQPAGTEWVREWHATSPNPDDA